MLWCWLLGAPPHDCDALFDGVCTVDDLLDVFVVDLHTGVRLQLSARRVQALVPCQASTSMLHEQRLSQDIAPHLFR